MVKKQTDINHGARVAERLHALFPSDRWITQAELAALMGRQRLNPSERAGLTLLVNQGRVEARQAAAHTVLIQRWEYRRKEDISDNQSEE